MSEKKPQTFANHGRLDPPFHFFMVPIAAIMLIGVIVHLVKHPTVGASWWLLIVALGAVVTVFKIRLYSLKVQDRVIRLEERLRLATLLQEPQRSRIGELSESQLIALRFAADTELPSLAKRALDEKLSNAEIKKAIVNWQPDYFRI